ncbi:2-oxoglutarate translocator [bacterium SM23_31]|nr:MAG: 2-oxoglutarate translocator [bacterium SM23_31]
MIIMNVIFKLSIILAVFLLIWFLPVPSGIEPNGIHLFAIFCATIIGLILKPVDMGGVVFVGIVITALTGTLTIKESLSGFSNDTVWLILSAFLISRGFMKTGVGKRVAYIFIRLFGRTTLGLSYSLIMSEFILAPAMPSNTARSGGIFYPIIRSLCSAYGSEPDKSPGKIGSFLILAQYHADVIISAMFLTSMAANLLIAEFTKNITGYEIQWTTWILGAIVPGILSLLLVPLVIYKITQPEIKKSAKSKTIADEELKKMGKMKKNEKTMLVIFLFILSVWITSNFHNVHVTTVALFGVALMIILGVLNWSDILGERNAWDAMIWFGGLIMMADGLSKYGVISWFSGNVSNFLINFPVSLALILMLVIYFYSHYGFASMTAHITALFPAFLGVAMSAGAPPLLAALALAYFSNLNASITHYATGPAPIYFNSGYVDLIKWWKIGFIVSVINVIIWIGIGFPYWKFCGFW